MHLQYIEGLNAGANDQHVFIWGRLKPRKNSSQPKIPIGFPLGNFVKKTMGSDRKKDENPTGNAIGNKIRSEI